MMRKHTPLCALLFASLALQNGCSINLAPEVEKQSTVSLTTGFNHVGLTVSDLDASVRFFTELLKWRKAGGYEDYPSVFVTDGNMFVTLWRASDPDTAVAFNRKTNVGLHHLAITVGSREALDVLHQRFVAAGNVTVEFAPELNGGGPTVHMMVREPSGNRLEFAYNPPR